MAANDLLQLQGFFIHAEHTLGVRHFKDIGDIAAFVPSGRILQVPFTGMVINGRGQMHDIYGDSAVTEFLVGDILTLKKQYGGRPQVIEYTFPAQVDGIWYGIFEKSAVGHGLAGCVINAKKKPKFLKPQQVLDLIRKTCPDDVRWQVQ